MKTQIIKIIPCLLAGFILSACVGAVNLADGTIAEAKTETPESETQTPKKLVIKEPEPQNKKVVESVEPKPIISVEPKPVLANPCIANPFGNACSVEFDFIRELACRHESDSERCAPTIMRICNANPFDSFCNANFNNAREIACASEPNSERCTSTTTRVCDADIFDNYCAEAEAYFLRQKWACERQPNSERCTITTARVCGANIFNSYCSGVKAHFDVQKMTCANEPSSARCSSVSSPICKADSLHAVCNRYVSNFVSKYKDYLYGDRDSSSDYSYRCDPWKERSFTDAAGCSSQSTEIREIIKKQKAICANELISERCVLALAGICGLSPMNTLCQEQKIEQVCSANSLDVLCVDNENYYLAQETACASEPNSARCAPTRARLCLESPFDMICQSNNLTLHDFPARTNLFKSTENSLPSGDCVVNYGVAGAGSYSAGCWGLYPIDTDIEPLNDNNGGTATYTGTVSIEYIERIGYSSAIIPNITKDIDIIANFDNNTLSYFGILTSLAFSIDGRFTSRGQITGSVNFNRVEGDLIGLIGQNEAIGIFSGRSSNFGEGDFAGGFLATRQEPEPENTPNQ